MVLIYASDMLWCHYRLLMVLFDDADFSPKMRVKINLLAKTDMGSGVYEYPQTKPKAPASSLGL